MAAAAIRTERAAVNVRVTGDTLRADLEPERYWRRARNMSLVRLVARLTSRQVSADEESRELGVPMAVLRHLEGRRLVA